MLAELRCPIFREHGSLAFWPFFRLAIASLGAVLAGFQADTLIRLAPIALLGRHSLEGAAHPGWRRSFGRAAFLAAHSEATLPLRGLVVDLHIGDVRPVGAATRPG